MPENRLTQTERSLAGQIGGHKSWANTDDRTARTAPARRAFEDRFLKEADGDPQRAESLRKAYYARLSLKSAQARRRRSRRDVIDARMAELDGGGDAA